MTLDQVIIIAIIAVTVGLFVWGRWRHDVVAAAALLGCVLTGLIPAEQAFTGFGHPAVITVACVLILSHALQTSGAVDAVTRRFLPESAGPFFTILLLTVLASVLSAFMNNVGALALLLPVALHVAAKQQIPPGKVLMPVAFGSILGGMTTLIGTPPNLIVSGFRAETGSAGFGMFDFTPVGIVVAGTGLVLIALLGRWLIPTRKRADVEGFKTGTYLTEARVPESSKAVGMSLYEIEEALEEADAQVVGLIRDEVRLPGPTPGRRIRNGDILIIEAEPEALASALSSLDLKLEADINEPEEEKEADADQSGDAGDDDSRAIESDEIQLTELAVMPDARLQGRSINDIQLRSRYGINLLAISRQGERSINRLRTTAINAGDVLLMQGTAEAITEFAAHFGCVPLAERELRIPDKQRALMTIGIMIIAVAGAAFGLLPAAIAFASGVVVALFTRVLSPRTVYDAVDWPVIILLGALIPVAGAMATTGTADLLAEWLLYDIARGNTIAALALILIVTMTLSDFMNNAATAAMMCPIAIGAAAGLGASADPFLMAVAVGASCAFLTPIGHQNNTLILGPGGFRFGDYWRLGLPLEIAVVVTGVPMILYIWPLA